MQQSAVNLQGLLEQSRLWFTGEPSRSSWIHTIIFVSREWMQTSIKHCYPPGIRHGNWNSNFRRFPPAISVFFRKVPSHGWLSSGSWPRFPTLLRTSSCGAPWRSLFFQGKGHFLSRAIEVELWALKPLEFQMKIWSWFDDLLCFCGLSTPYLTKPTSQPLDPDWVITTMSPRIWIGKWWSTPGLSPSLSLSPVFGQPMIVIPRKKGALHLRPGGERVRES